eukprot:5755002-Pleurochrysis_carterae.AAC.2
MANQGILCARTLPMQVRVKSSKTSEMHRRAGEQVTNLSHIPAAVGCVFPALCPRRLLCNTQNVGTAARVMLANCDVSSLLKQDHSKRPNIRLPDIDVA